MGLATQLIPLADSKSWNQALDKVNHTYAHTHWYNQAMHAANQRDIYLLHVYEQGFAAVCPISPRRKQAIDCYDITTPYGFSGIAATGSHAEFSQVWLQTMQQQNFVCGHIALNPLLTLDTFQTDLYAGKQAYFLDLTLPIEQLFQHLAQDHRQRLRQWQNKNYQVTLSKEEAILKNFTTQYAAALAARGAASIYDFGETAWRILLNSPQATLFSVQEEGNTTASALFIEHDNVADYFMIASAPHGRQHARGLIWQAMTFYKNKGIQWLHLGCGVRANDDLEQFKARFGARPMTTYALKQIYQPTLYQILCQKYQSALNKEGYFPSYWAPNLSKELV